LPLPRPGPLHAPVDVEETDETVAGAAAARVARATRGLAQRVRAARLDLQLDQISELRGGCGKITPRDGSVADGRAGKAPHVLMVGAAESAPSDPRDERPACRPVSSDGRTGKARTS
jgi:hypothetical protein